MEIFINKVLFPFAMKGDLKKQIEAITKKIEFLEKQLKHSQKELIKQALKEFIKEREEDRLKQEIMRKYRKNRKNIIKQKILETIKLKPMLLEDLKYYIVDQLKYCSKASFYRYIKEMKDLIEIKNKVVYPAGIVKDFFLY